METQEKICRLCLKICDSFKALEEHMKNFLDKLLLKINLAAVQKPVVCTNCAEMLEKCYDFKAMCLNVHDDIAPFVNDKDSIKPDLIDMCLSGNEKGNGVPEDQEICAFCRSPIRNCSTITPRVEKGDVLLKKMIKQCLPELDLSIIKKFVICTTCRESLVMFFHFLTNCLMVEENIKKYCETHNINSTDQIELSNLLQFTIRNAAAIEVDGNLIDIVKIKELCDEIEDTDERKIGMGRDITLEQMSYGDSEDAKVEIKHETMEMTDLKFNNEEEFTNRNMLGCKEESDRLDGIKTEETFCEENEIKEENFVEMEDQKFLVNEEIEIKTEESDFNRLKGHISPYVKVAAEVRTYKCDSCSFQTKYKSNLKKHLLGHKDPSEVIMNKCDSCSYQTKYEFRLKKHLLVHKDPSEVEMYKCGSCSYQSKCKNKLKQHLVVHKNPSEVTMHKCDSCSFQTKHKNSLKKHFLRLHKDPSEVTMYKCDSCSYQTKCKANLTGHLLVHRNPSEITMYKCDSCSYQTKYEVSIKKHLLVHKNPSEIEMYKCGSCPYQTKSKIYLKRHLVVHRNPSEVTMHKCDSCSFQTKHKGCLKSHFLRLHKDPSELTMYKCDSCSHQTKCKEDLKRHLLVHRNPSEVTMYKCDSCSYQTKYEVTLKKHLLVHKDPLEVKIYKCGSCSYQTKFRSNLKQHLVVHRNASEVTIYKCDSCSFQSKYESNHKYHLLLHKDPSEVTLYQCVVTNCSFKTKRKRYLKQHFLRLHKDPSEITMFKKVIPGASKP